MKKYIEKGSVYIVAIVTVSASFLVGQKVAKIMLRKFISFGHDLKDAIHDGIKELKEEAK